MHLLEHLHRNVKTVAMPTAMVVGALLCRPISALEELSGADDHPDADLPDAVRHLLPRETQPDEAFDAPCVAAAGSDGGLHRGFSAAASAGPHSGAGGDGLRAGSRGDGRGGHRRHAGGQRRHDGHVQSALQHGRRSAGSGDSDLHGDGGVLLSRRSWPASRRCW